MLKLYLDDIRDCPGREYELARSYENCVALMEIIDFPYVSLDYDLSDIYTGYDVLVWMKENKKFPKYLNIHSTHSYGRSLMLDYARDNFPSYVEITADERK